MQLVRLLQKKSQTQKYYNENCNIHFLAHSYTTSLGSVFMLVVGYYSKLSAPRVLHREEYDIDVNVFFLLSSFFLFFSYSFHLQSHIHVC